MPVDDSELEEAYKRLLSWTKTLLNVAENSLPEIRLALDPSSELPENCPSHASMAMLVFGEVRKKFREVEGAIEDVEKAIRSQRKSEHTTP